MSKDSSSNHHPPSGVSEDPVNSPRVRGKSVPFLWTQVVQGQAESTSSAHHSPSPPQSPSIGLPAPEQPSVPDTLPESSSSPPPRLDIAESSGVNDNVSRPKKAAWNKPSSNGVMEKELVMGAADIWPPLSESARASPRSVEAPWKSGFDGTGPSSEGQMIPHSPKKQSSSNAKATSVPNKTMLARQRSSKHISSGSSSSGTPGGGGPLESSFAHPLAPPLAPPPPPPHSFIKSSDIIPPPMPDHSQIDHRYRGTLDSRPATGFGHHPNMVNEHRNTSRRGNYGPRGNGPSHNNYGGRKQDRGNFGNAGDIHIPSQRGHPRTFIRPSNPISIHPFVPPQNMRPFPNYVGFPDMVYLPPPMMPPFMHPGPYTGMIMPFPEPIPAPEQILSPEPMPVSDPLEFSIMNQINYYFSDTNLKTDEYLKSKMDNQGWVPISLIAGFPRIESMTDSIQVVLDSIRGSVELEVQGNRVRKRNGWEKWIQSSSTQPPSGSTSPSAGTSGHDVVAMLDNLNLSETCEETSQSEGVVRKRPTTLSAGESCFCNGEASEGASLAPN